MDFRALFWTILGIVIFLVAFERCIFPLFVYLIDLWHRFSLRGAKIDSDYHVLVTPREIACEHRKRRRESVLWEDVIRVCYVTTSDGPWLPDEWLLFESATGGCSVPTEARNFELIWDELKARFPGFDYEPILRGGTDNAHYLCWKKNSIS